MSVKIKEIEIINAAKEGNESFVNLFAQRILSSIGGELNTETMQALSPDQITLLAYQIVKREVLEGGFIQLIYNGYGNFIFRNPFAKAMRLWGARELSKIINKANDLFLKYGDDLTRERTDEEFMALYEQYEVFDDLDDDFIEMEPEFTEIVAHYIDENVGNFMEIVKD